MTLEDAMQALCNAPGGPVAELARRGVKGVPRDCDGCVLAVALSAATGKDVAIEDEGVAVCGGRVRLPMMLRLVVRQFDRGELPEFVATRKEGAA